MQSQFRVLLLCLGAATAAWGQVAGSILGTVMDTSGAPVAGAQVVITEINRNTSQTYTTDSTGSYNAPFLPPGSYTVSVQQSGFKKEVRSGVTLQVDQHARVDFSLQLGAVTETVNVTASAPLVRSESAELGEVIEERAVRELPLNGRNFAQLV
jgi:hypothetical protein